MLKRCPPPLFWFPSLLLLLPRPGVFLEVYEKGNLNRLPLKGMSGSSRWKLVLLMTLTFSMRVGHLWLWVYVYVQCCVQCRNAVGWLGWGGERKDGGLASRPTSSGEEGGQGHIWHISGAIAVWFKMQSSSWRCGWAARQTAIKGGEERWTSRSTSCQSHDAGGGRWRRLLIPSQS